MNTLDSPAFQGKKAKPHNEGQDASAGAGNLGSVALRGNLDPQLNSRRAWRKAGSFASQPAFVISQQLTFPPDFTFDGNEKQNRSRALTLKHSSKKRPDNCNQGWWCVFFCSFGH